jgi:hypothetical protein
MQGHMSVLWDAIAVACEGLAARECVVTSALLLSMLCEAALGHGTKTADRIAALHALANVSGAEALGPHGDPGNAMLTEQVCPWGNSCCV